jgi:hypothetical protein
MRRAVIPYTRAETPRDRVHAAPMSLPNTVRSWNARETPRPYKIASLAEVFQGYVAFQGAATLPAGPGCSIRAVTVRGRTSQSRVIDVSAPKRRFRHVERRLLILSRARFRALRLGLWNRFVSRGARDFGSGGSQPPRQSSSQTGQIWAGSDAENPAWDGKGAEEGLNDRQPVSWGVQTPIL